MFRGISIIYYSAVGLSGRVWTSSMLYRFEDSTYAVNWETETTLIELVRMIRMHRAVASRHIEGDWYIELWYDK